MANRFGNVAKKESDNLVGNNKLKDEETISKKDEHLVPVIEVKEQVKQKEQKKGKGKYNSAEEEIAITFGKERRKDVKKPKNLYLKQSTIDIIETCGDRKKYNYYEGEIVDLAIEMWYKSLGLDIVKES